MKDDLRKAMTVLDKVLKEVLAMRQEQTMFLPYAIKKVPAVAQHLS